jgi:hypothetical protein
MMSAPSWASRIACERPWPRAAPVMKATLPFTRPVIAVPSASLLVPAWLRLLSGYLVRKPASTGSVTPVM